MAGVGPPPKAADRRARRNKDLVAGRQVSVLPMMPQELPSDLLPDGEEWHTATLRWWKRWCESPLAENLPEVDWSELEACAVLHHEFMRKRSFTLGSELRLRMAKWGATPEDRARLRITIADADAKDSSQKPTGSSSRERRGALRSLPPITG
jgi:hypothetical protein